VADAASSSAPSAAATLSDEHRALAQRVSEQRERANRLRALADHVEEQAARDEHMLRELEGLLGIAPQLRLEQLDRCLRGQRLEEVAIEILTRKVAPGQPVHYREWFDLLRQAGHCVGGKDPFATFLAQVNRSPSVERLGRRSGMYRLRAA